MVYLPLASQHLDVKTIGRGGPLRRLFKPDKWTPLFACMSTVAGRSGPATQCPRWVKNGKPQCEQMFSALALKADIAQQSRHVRFVPTTEVALIRSPCRRG